MTWPDEGLNANNSFGNGNGRLIFNGLSGVPEHKPGYFFEHDVPDGQDEQGSPILYIWEPIKFPAIIKFGYCISFFLLDDKNHIKYSEETFKNPLGFITESILNYNFPFTYHSALRGFKILL